MYSGRLTAARVVRLLGYATSGDALLRLQRAEVFSFVAPMALGVDEFAYPRGRTFDTLVVDLEDILRLNPELALDYRLKEGFH